MNSDLIIVISREHELYAIDVNILRVITAYLDDSLIVFSPAWVVYPGCHSGASVRACGNHDNIQSKTQSIIIKS